MIGRFEYTDTTAMFKTIGNGPIETDAQFAKVLYDKYGPGIYSLIAINKGHSGFWSFWKVELTFEGFRNLHKTRNFVNFQKKKLFGKINGLKRRLEKDEKNKTDQHKKLSEGEKEKIKNKLKSLKEVADTNFSEEDEEFDKMLSEFDNSEKRGPFPYLKQLQPVYNFHVYQPLKIKDTNEAEINGLW